MNRYVIDTHGWIEYFRGSSAGEKLGKLLGDGKNKFITGECSIAEIKCWTLREAREFEVFARIVEENSSVEPVTMKDWLYATDLRHEMRKTRKDFGLIDAVILAKQKRHDCTLISGDADFKGLPNVLFLG